MRELLHPIIAAVGPSGGESALIMARVVAAHAASPLAIVSVVEPPPVYDFGGRGTLLNEWPIDQHIAERRQEIANRMHHVDVVMGATATAVVEIAYGTPAVAIADVACDMQARLIVIGAGPDRPRHRLFAAGTALHTSRRAGCPVLAVRTTDKDLPRCVVVATDFAPASLHAALQALPVMADDATMHLVHVWQRFGTSGERERVSAIDEGYAQSLPERFARVHTLLSTGNLRAINDVTREGSPADAVLHVARELSADLLVVGTRGLGNIASLVVGSVSSAIFRGSACSVLLVPLPDAAQVARIERHMTGTSTVIVADAWSAELESFARRNLHRRTSLELDDRVLGAQVQHSGYMLAGATYDPHDRHIELMFEPPARSGAHFTHAVSHVRSVGVKSNSAGRDDVLCIESNEGTALLTFLTATSPDHRNP